MQENQGSGQRTQEGAHSERRGADRRRSVWGSLLRGSLTPRRRALRRAGEHTATTIDWHDPHWLAIALLIVLFSCADAMLTLMLMQQGAYEANPLMAPLVEGSVERFAVIKIALTAAGVLFLTQLTRVRAFGGLRVGVILYSVLALYCALVAYEYSMLTPG